MPKPPYSRLEKEAHDWYGKPYEECNEEEKMLCEDMAWEYCVISP